MFFRSKEFSSDVLTFGNKQPNRIIPLAYHLWWRNYMKDSSAYHYAEKEGSPLEVWDKSGKTPKSPQPNKDKEVRLEICFSQNNDKFRF